MKKAIIAVLSAAAMALSMTACGGTGSSSSSSSSQSGSSSASSSDSASGKAIKVGMVTDVGGVNDGSFNQSAWEGLQKAGTELGIEVKYLESKTDADYSPNLEAFADEEYDLIISVGYMLASATKEAAEANPDQKYAIIDDSSNASLPNVTCLMFEQAQASYLAGLVAGMSTESNTVGFVLGMASETMHQFGYGYVAGVLDANKDAKVLQFNANSFGDTAVGKSSATTMITNGADVIFHAAGGTGMGVIEGCKENGVWAIGVDSDQSKLAPENILTSAMKRVDTAVFEAAKATQDGTLKNGVITYDLAVEGVDLAPTTTNLSDEVLKAAEDAKAKIISGEIKVPETKADFEAKYGEVYELD